MDTDKTYRDNVMKLADRILKPCDSRPIGDPDEALKVILSFIGENVLAGTDQAADPEHSTLDQCTASACFLAACSVPLISGLQETGYETDALSLMHKVGERVFKKYPESDRKLIIDSGILLFKDLALQAKGIHKLKEWLTSINNVTNRYVLTLGDTDCVELFAPLYMVLLMATKQVKQS